MGLFPTTKPLRYFAAGGITLSALLAGTSSLFFDSHATVERQKGRMPHEVYVWQRHWDPTLLEAIEQAADQTSSFSVLAAEVSWSAGRVDQVVCVPIDYNTLKATQKPVGLALRIGPYSGPFDKCDSATTLITSLAASLVTDARLAGIEPAELQIDFDCAESKLNGYCQWVRAFREKIHPVPVTITVLPCWLKKKAFAGLARAADAFVLQVHSLEQPKSPDSPIALCDFTAALRWVEQAARTGVPFRVALPTYGYLVAFNEEGRFIGLCAEGPSQTWVGDTNLRIVRSDPIATAKLVRDFRADRPGSMRGIIWYRLPIESDRLNWKWTTLSAIMDGQIPREELQVEVEYPQPELAEVVLTNSGQADLSAEVRIEIECDRDKLVAADGLCGFALAETKPSRVYLEYGTTTISPMIRAGEQWKIAWLRFKHETEAKPHVIMHQE
jgi:hypothetical protein